MANLNITIGQYIHGESYLYRLDPRLKMIATALLMTSIFLVPNLYGMLGIAIIFLIVIVTAKLPLWKIILGLRPIIFLVLFSFILQIIYTSKGSVIMEQAMQFSLWHLLSLIAIILAWIFTSRFIPFKLLHMLASGASIYALLVFWRVDNQWSDFSLRITDAGIYNAGYFISRIVLVVILTSTLTMCTSTTDINNGTESLMHPFRKFLPVGEIAMMLSLTLRFIPTTLVETQKIMAAQASRGIDFNEGNIIQKVRQMLSLLIPLFVVSIIRAGELAYTMEARGYVIGAERTHYQVLKWHLRDTIVLIGIFLLLGAIIVWVVL